MRPNVRSALRLALLASTLLLLAVSALACTQQVRDDQSLPSRGVVVPTPDKSVFLRASFDDDPSTYIGRFLPDNLQPHEVDENQAVSTRCGKFITYKEVGASGTYDEYYNSSTSAGASVGLAGVASASAGGGAGSTVRVQYELSKKMRAEISDQAGFEQCCKEAGCPSFIVGEFFKGTGSVFQAVGAKTDFSGEGISPSGVTGELDFKDEVAWRRQSNFTDVYFAFRKQRVGLGDATADANDCSWANSVPTDLDGKYFVGVSVPAADESTARNLAITDARQQAIRYLGESISTSTTLNTSALEGVLSDKTVLTTAAGGIANYVKDRKWCPAERLDTPEGTKFTVRVLAYFPNAEKAEAEKAVAGNLLTTLKQAGKLTPELEKGLKPIAEGKK